MGDQINHTHGLQTPTHPELWAEQRGKARRWDGARKERIRGRREKRMVGIPGGCRTLLSSPAPLWGGGRLGGSGEVDACKVEPRRRDLVGRAGPEEGAGPQGKGAGHLEVKGPMTWKGQKGGGAIEEREGLGRWAWSLGGGAKA